MNYQASNVNFFFFEIEPKGSLISTASMCIFNLGHSFKVIEVTQSQKDKYCVFPDT